MNTNVVPEKREYHVEQQTVLVLVLITLLLVIMGGALVAVNWHSWGMAFLIWLGVLVGLLAAWKIGTVVHDRYLHHKDRTITHKHTTMQLQLAERAMVMGHSVSMKHTDHLGRIHELQTISPLTIPNAPVTIKEMTFGGQEQIAPALPIAPPFSHLASQIKPGHLFLAQGQQAPIWGDITDLLSTLDVGRPGTGKSTLLRMVCAQVLLIGGLPIIFDPHGSILDDLGSSFECAESPQDIAQYAKTIDGWLTGRLQQRRAGRVDFEPMLLLVDEMPIISEMSPEALPVIRRVVLEGRKVGMFALISGQGVPATTLGGTLVRDAMASRYVFCTSAQQARMAGIENETAKQMMAILEDAGPGKAVLATSNRKPEIVAIPNTTTDDIRALLETRKRSETQNGNGPETPVQGSSVQVVDEIGNVYTDTDELSVDESVLTGNAVRETIKRLYKRGLPLREIAPLVGMAGRKYEQFKKICEEEGL